FWSVWGDVRTNTAQVFLSALLLPHQAYLMSDAILRTVYRKLISRKKLLEWVTAADAERTARNDLSSMFRFMWQAELLALLAIVVTFIVDRAALPVAAAVGLVWLTAPAIAWWLSRPRPAERKLLNAEDM